MDDGETFVEADEFTEGDKAELAALLARPELWLSTTWGGLRHLSGRWVRKDQYSMTHAKTIERWVHDGRQLVIEEELRAFLDKDMQVEYERASWGLWSLFNGQRTLLLIRETWLDMPLMNSLGGWKVSRMANVLHPPEWNDVYAVSSTGVGLYYKGTVSLQEGKETYHLHEEVQDRLDAALLVGPSVYVHGATVRDEERGVLGEYKLCADAVYGQPAYECDRYMIYQQGDCWQVRLDGDGENVLEAREASSLPTCVPPGSWSMWYYALDEDTEGFRRALVPAPKIQCTAGAEGKKLYEDCEKEFLKTKQRDARAQELRVPGAVKVGVSDLRAGHHIFYPTQRGAVYHHAIVISNENGNCIVIHFNQGSKHEGGVKKVALHNDPRFSSCDTLYCVNRSDYYRGRIRTISCTGGKYPLERSADEIVRKATEVFRSQGKGYRFEYSAYAGLSNNCEHFCTFCCTGERYCYQKRESFWQLSVAAARTVAGAAAGAAAGVAGAAAVTAAVAVTAPITLPLAAAGSVSGVAAASMWQWKRLNMLRRRVRDVSEANEFSPADDPPS